MDFPNHIMLPIIAHTWQEFDQLKGICATQLMGLVTLEGIPKVVLHKNMQRVYRKTRHRFWDLPANDPLMVWLKKVWPQREVLRLIKLYTAHYQCNTIPSYMKHGGSSHVTGMLIPVVTKQIFTNTKRWILYEGIISSNSSLILCNYLPSGYQGMIVTIIKLY